MIDGHVHIEKQSYSLDTILKMCEVAKKKNINTLHILDHTHKFIEFSFLYDNLKDEKTIMWYKKKKPISINEYLRFVEEMRKIDFGINVYFGLEVCYFKECKDKLKEILLSLPLDFYVGSIHFVDGIAIDLEKCILEEYDIDKIYREYFFLELDLIKSKMFRSVGHLDAIKLFNIKPSFDVLPFYRKILEESIKCDVIVENNSGIIRYGYPYPGLASDIIDLIKELGVKTEKSSDAHVYTDIGRAFDKLY